MANKVSRVKLNRAKVNNKANNKANKAHKVTPNRAARTNERSNAVSIICPNVCRRRSKARADRTVRARKKASIARVSSRTISIHCAGVWMREVSAVNKASSRVNKVSKASNSAKVSAVRVRKANRAKRANRDRTDNAENKANKDRAKDNRARRVSRDSQDSKVNNRVNSKAANNQAGRKTAATVAATGNMLDHSGDLWAVTGATTGNSHPNSANGFAKLRTCDASGAQPDSAPAGSTK